MLLRGASVRSRLAAAAPYWPGTQKESAMKKLGYEYLDEAPYVSIPLPLLWHTRLSATDREVLCYIRGRQGAQSFISLGQRLIAKELGHNRTTVTRCIRVLEAEGLLVTKGEEKRRLDYDARPLDRWLKKWAPRWLKKTNHQNWSRNATSACSQKRPAHVAKSNQIRPNWSHASTTVRKGKKGKKGKKAKTAPFASHPSKRPSSLVGRRLVRRIESALGSDFCLERKDRQARLDHLAQRLDYVNRREAGALEELLEEARRFAARPGFDPPMRVSTLLSARLWKPLLTRRGFAMEEFFPKQDKGIIDYNHPEDDGDDLDRRNIRNPYEGLLD